MAIDHTSLSGYPIFPSVLNWKNDPGINLAFSSIVVGFPSTTSFLIPQRIGVPVSIAASVLLETKNKEKVLFDFFDTCRGMVKQFWIKFPILQYELYATAIATQSFLLVKPIKTANQAYSQTGHERIFLHHLNGNSCIKKINSAVDNGNHIRLNLDAALVNTWTLGDTQIIMGQLKLVRFDMDELQVDYATDSCSEIPLKFRELIYESMEI